MIKPTRSELLKTRKRVKLAKRGHELLKKKQDSLIMEFFNLLKDVRGGRKELQDIYVKAQERMNQVRSLESDLKIQALALAAKQHSPVELSVKNIAGVRVPEIRRVTKEQAKPVFDSLLIQDVAVQYREILDKILDLAAKETALRKILDEIKRIKRRAYALEKILIPELEEAITFVTLTLEEREREEFSRLKRMKA